MVDKHWKDKFNCSHWIYIPSGVQCARLFLCLIMAIWDKRYCNSNGWLWGNLSNMRTHHNQVLLDWIERCTNLHPNKRVLWELGRMVAHSNTWNSSVLFGDNCFWDLYHLGWLDELEIASSYNYCNNRAFCMFHFWTRFFRSVNYYNWKLNWGSETQRGIQ